MSSFIWDKGRVNTRRRPFLLLSSLSTHVPLYIPSPPHPAALPLPRRVQITEDERLNQQFPSVDPTDSGNPSMAAPNKALCKQSSTIFQRRVSKLLSRPEINLVGVSLGTGRVVASSHYLAASTQGAAIRGPNGLKMEEEGEREASERVE